MYAALFAFRQVYARVQVVQGADRRCAASVGEQVAESQAFGQVVERFQMPIVGTHSLLPPPPDGDGIDPDSTGDLRPRQARRVLEPSQTLREVVWHWVCSSPVSDALSTHGAPALPHGASGLPPAGASRPTGIRARGGTRSADSRRPSSPRAREHPFRARPPPRPDIHLCGLSSLPGITAGRSRSCSRATRRSHQFDRRNRRRSLRAAGWKTSLRSGMHHCR